ncbi:MAG: hypothetical protein Q7S36_03270 [Candidatus Liptonbacteria bacterium]|nr:hypothetical protein [Candidatus Liptonbacteria bacterium]
MKNKATIIWVVVGVLVLGGIIWAATVLPNQPDKFDDFATCLKEKEVVFYGAFWCPHCQNQKAAFGRSERLLPYVECSKPDGQSLFQICIDKDIKNYPTWEFKDGSRELGEVSMEKLAEKSGCILPGEDAPDETSTLSSSSPAGPVLPK